MFKTMECNGVKIIMDEFGEVSDITQMAFAKAAKLIAGEDELSV